MSESLGKNLPTELLELLSQETPPRQAFPLVTLGEAGFPHCMILSFYEVLYQDGLMYLLIPSGATSATNLRRNNKILLIFFHPPQVTYLKGRAKVYRRYSDLLILEVEVEEVLSDQPTEVESDAELIRGLEFRTSPSDLRRRTQLREEVRKLWTDA